MTTLSVVLVLVLVHELLIVRLLHVVEHRLTVVERRKRRWERHPAVGR